MRKFESRLNELKGNYFSFEKKFYRILKDGILEIYIQNEWCRVSKEDLLFIDKNKLLELAEHGCKLDF